MTEARSGRSSSGSDVTGTIAEPRRANVRYPGGLSARYRWVGSGGAPALFALSEAGGTLTDHGGLVAEEPDRLCRAELRVEGPVAVWTARLASTISDEPSAVFWDATGLLVVKYGFGVYAFVARTGELRWHRLSATPLVAVLGSSRLDHIIAQSEVETVALDEAGATVWRIAHSDVVAEAELVGGRLILTSYDGQVQGIDPETGEALGRP